MTDTTRSHRGRPVGSGIDDSNRLSAVADLLAAHPGMKPTTAIKQLGFTDPSVVRRLRDKLKSAEPTPNAAAEPTPARTVAAAADNVRPFRLSEEAPRPRPDSQRQSTGSADPLLAVWLELAVGTINTTLALQQAMLGMMLKHPLVRSALHQHIAANDLAMSLLRVPASPRRRV